jgi:hypothetical protein
LHFAAEAVTSLDNTCQERYVPRRNREVMRAEVERLVEDIKQSVGLLRRHL